MPQLRVRSRRASASRARSAAAVFVVWILAAIGGRAAPAQVPWWDPGVDISAVFFPGGFPPPASPQCNLPGATLPPGLYGNPFLPTFGTYGNFRVGRPSGIALQGGLAFIGGFADVALQIMALGASSYSVCQTVGVAGDYYLDPANVPTSVIYSGRLLGQLNAGNSPPIVLIIPPDPALVGTRLGIQAFLTTQILTNPTWSRFLVIEIQP